VTPSFLCYSLGVGGLLGEHAEHKVSLRLGLKGGRHDDVLAGRQAEARAHLPQVDEELRARRGAVRQEVVSLQVDGRLAHILGGRRVTVTVFATFQRLAAMATTLDIEFGLAAAQP